MTPGPIKLLIYLFASVLALDIIRFYYIQERDGREKLLLCCRLLSRARPFGTHGGGEGRGISWRPPAYSLFSINNVWHRWPWQMCVLYRVPVSLWMLYIFVFCPFSCHRAPVARHFCTWSDLIILEWQFNLVRLTAKYYVDSAYVLHLR